MIRDSRGLAARIAVWISIYLLGAGVQAHAGSFTINPIWHSSVTSSPDAAQYESAFLAAAQAYQDIFSNAVTINIDVQLADLGGGGSSLALPFEVGYDPARSAIIASATSAADFASLPYLPSTYPGLFLPQEFAGGGLPIARANAKALGLLPSGANPAGLDGYIYFDSNASYYSFDPNNRAVAGKGDLIGIAEHEISEVLGRGQGSGPFQLFRYSAPGTWDPSGNTDYFSIDGGATNLSTFNDPNKVIQVIHGSNYTETITQGGDGWDWDGNDPSDAFNAFGTPGRREVLSSQDITALDVIGYTQTSDTVPTPEPSTFLLVGAGFFAATATSRWKHRRN